MIDSHCHLFDEKLIARSDEIIKNFKNENIDFIVMPSYDYISEKQAFEMAQNYQNVFCALAIHPHDAINYNEECENFVIEHYNNKKVVALGEFGFDYYYNLSPYKKQIQIAERQFNLCNECDLPAIFHIRDGKSNEVEHYDAYKDFFDIANNIDIKRHGVLHCFSGNIQQAKKALDLGYYISFTCNVTYNNNEYLRDAVKYIPLDRLLIETDSPYMSPKDQRKIPNEPKNVKFVAECFAELKNIDFEMVCDITTQNAKDLFYKITL